MRGLRRRLTLAIASAAFVAAWGSGFLIAKLGPLTGSPLTLLFWRFLPVACVLVLLGWITGSFRVLRLDEFGRQVVVAVLGQFGYCVLVYVGIARGVATGTSALIDALQPIVIATLVGPVLGLSVRPQQWLGLVCGLVGTVVLVVSQIGGVRADPLALGFPLGAMVCLIAATLVDRRFPSTVPVRTAITIHTATTAAALALLCAVTGTIAPPASGTFWAAAFVAATGPALLGFGLYWYLLRRVGVTALNGLLFLVLPVTAVAGSVLFGEDLGVGTFVGFGLCAGGVALVLLHSGREGSAERPG